MLDNGLCETPFGVECCKSALVEVRQQLDTSGGEVFRQLVACLSRAIEVVEGVAAAKNKLFEVMKSSDQEGDAMLQSGDFSGAAQMYKASVEHCEKALAKRTSAADTAAWNERFVTACSKAAVACLKHGASKKAEFFCTEALRVQPSHAEATVRLGEARKAYAESEQEIRGPYIRAKAASTDLCNAGKFREATVASREAADIAHRAGEAVFEAKSKAIEAEMLRAVAVKSGGDTWAVERSAAAAREVKDFCRERKDMPDFLLTNIATVDPKCMLNTSEAHGWLVLAQHDLDFHDAPTAAREKLTNEVLRLLDQAEDLLFLDEMEVVVLNLGGGMRHLLVTTFVRTGEWRAAADAAEDLLLHVRAFSDVSVDYLMPAFRQSVMKAAYELSNGPMPQCHDISNKLLEFINESAQDF
jgi:tetratricopeptide (TPR) repeat protein